METVHLLIGLCGKLLQWLLITFCAVGFATCVIWLRLNFFGGDLKIITPSYPQQMTVTMEEWASIQIEREMAANQGTKRR